MTPKIDDVIERLKKKNHMSTTFWRDMYADLLTHCRIQEVSGGGEAAQEEKYDRVRWDIGPDGYSVTVYFQSEKPMFEFYQKIASPPESK